MNKSVCYLILAHVLDNVKLEKKNKTEISFQLYTSMTIKMGKR